jgi:hypothetical protein
MTPVHLPALKDGAPCQTRTGFYGVQVRRIATYAYRAEILEPVERIERSSVAYHATVLPLSYIGWSQRGHSKPRPPRYECGALPLELLRHGAGAENRTPLTGLAIRCPANRPHPQKVLERT